MNGIHEVSGSIPLGSTIKINYLVITCFLRNVRSSHTRLTAEHAFLPFRALRNIRA